MATIRDSGLSCLSNQMRLKRIQRERRWVEAHHAVVLAEERAILDAIHCDKLRLNREIVQNSDLLGIVPDDEGEEWQHA